MIDIFAEDRPYRPSIINRLTVWVRKLEFHAVAFYLIILVGALVLAYIGRWAAGVLPSGTWSLLDFYETFSGPVLTFAVLAFSYHLDDEILEAVDRSKSIFAGSDDEFERFRYRFAVMPLLPELLVGVAFGAAGSAAGLEFYGISRIDAQSVPIILDWGLTAFFVFAFAYRVARLIAVMGQFYASELNLSLYNLPPVYELSSVAGKAGVFLLILWYPNLPLNLDKPMQEDLFRVIVAAFISAIPLAAFLVPLALLNRRLTDEKTRLLVKISGNLESAFDKLQKAFQSGNLAGMSDLESAIANFVAQKKLIESIPTWPWRQGTFRLAVTAVMLPVVVWLIQEVLDRAIGF